MSKIKFKSGFISIIGRPNAGKSTFLNSIMGTPISSVSPKQQTTRNRITGILTGDDHQLVFLDTPGITTMGTPLNRILNSSAKGTLELGDLILYMIDVANYKKDPEIESMLSTAKTPVICALNKIDAINKSELLPIIDHVNRTGIAQEIVPISALKEKNLHTLKDLLISMMPEGELYYPKEFISSNPESFIMAEAIKGTVFNLTSQEIPYSTAVRVDEITEKKNIIVVNATIFVEKSSQKGMIIGKKGAMMKRIGSTSRLLLEELFSKKFFLELFVKVKPNWTKDDRFLRELGYKY